MVCHLVIAYDYVPTCVHYIRVSWYSFRRSAPLTNQLFPFYARGNSCQPFTAHLLRWFTANCHSQAASPRSRRARWSSSSAPMATAWPSSTCVITMTTVATALTNWAAVSSKPSDLWCCGWHWLTELKVMSTGQQKEKRLTLCGATADFGEDRTCEEKLCQQECTNLDGTGFICSCRPGYEVNPDSTFNCLGIHTTHAKKSLCIAWWPKKMKLSDFLFFWRSFFSLADINECEQYGICPQICRNTKGSYSCSCAPGYREVGDGKMCEAEGENGSTSCCATESSENLLKDAQILWRHDWWNHIFVATFLNSMPSSSTLELFLLFQ